eukprot:TRINITY_DN2169_c0_g1_i18.p1 TRINITY_DN2169_c0_g1~~TRINITY_DN2169_c0_g1_i18.p1  ORF type:complete len:352 (-),score=81.44 TRINITY_DN2169_c0_g1_i18:152-1207(-)
MCIRDRVSTQSTWDYYAMKQFPIYLVILSAVCMLCNDTPLIGILTKPLAEEYPTIKTRYKEVVEAKYAHFVEAGGGRAVAISYKWSKAKMHSLMKKLNGLLFVGGGIELVNEDRTELNEYSQGAQRAFDIALEFNENGDYFPVWGTCLGFELIMILESKNTKLLQPCKNCDNYDIFLAYDEKNAPKSRLFVKGFTRYELHIMKTQNVTFNNHEWMIDYNTYKANKLLVEKYNVLAYSPSKDSKIEYIAAMEHKTHPIYAVQFHPEKYNYEVNPKQPVKRSFASITISHSYANFFVDEARKSGHAFKSAREEMQHVVQRSYPYYHAQYGYLYFFAKGRGNEDFYRGEEDGDY